MQNTPDDPRDALYAARVLFAVYYCGRSMRFTLGDALRGPIRGAVYAMRSSGQGRQRFSKFQFLKVDDLKNVTEIEFNRKFSVKNSVFRPKMAYVGLNWPILTT